MIHHDSNHKYTNYHGFKLFACESSPIHSAIIRELNAIIRDKNPEENITISLSKKHYERFPDGETLVHQLESVRDCDCFIIAQPRLGDMLEIDLREIKMLTHALKYIGSAYRVNLVIPYLPYQKQDRESKARQPVSIKMLLREFEVNGARNIITLQLHNPYTRYYTDTFKVEDVGTTDFFLKKLAELYGESFKEITFAAADLGAAKFVRNAAELAGGRIAILDKRRKKGSREPEVMNVIGKEYVKGRHVILLDDQLATGKTAANGAQAILNEGALSVSMASTHPLLLQNAPELLQNSAFSRVIGTNSYPIPDQKRFEKLEIISIAELLAIAIDNVHNAGSITKLVGEGYF